MDIKRLRYFYTIAKHGSFSKAAKELHISQPPLSQRLKELEEELGVELITRNSRSLVLTKEGEFVYDKVSEMMKLLEAIPKGIARLKNRNQEIFHIGVSPTCLSHLVRYMPFIHLEFPEVYISVVTGDSTYLERVLHENQIDVALIQCPQKINTNYEITMLKPTEIVAVLPKFFEAEGNTVSFQELAQFPLALLKRVSGFGSYDVLMHSFHQQNLNPVIVMDSPEVQTIINFLAIMPHAASILPSSELDKSIYDNHCVMSLDKQDFLMHPCLVNLKEKNDISILKRLKSLAQTTQISQASL